MLNEEDKLLLLSLARKTLEQSFIDAIEPPNTDIDLGNPTLSEALLKKQPCFVTLMTQAGRLRGCIGCIATESALYHNVCEFTQHAAFSDPRFEPVKKDEVSGLKIHVSVLGPLQRLPSLDGLQIGKQGLCVRYQKRQGLLLAKVASQYDWSPEEFLKQTCQKAGLPPENHATYDIFYFEELSFCED